MSLLQNPVFVEQYKHYRSLVGDTQKQRDEATRFAIVANAAIAGWVVTSKAVVPAAYVLPIFATTMLFVYWLGIRKKVIEAGDMLAVLEEAAGLTAETGAELRFRRRPHPKKTAEFIDPHPWHSVFRTREIWVWVALLLFGFLFAWAVGAPYLAMGLSGEQAVAVAGEPGG